MIKLSRRFLATAAAVLAVGAGAATCAATAASATPPRAAGPGYPIPRCAPGQLYVWVSPDSANGTAGTTYFNLDFTNKSAKECHLYAWPGVSATNGNGKPLGPPADRNPAGQNQYVNIAPNAAAHSSLGLVDVQVVPGCRPATATLLKVYPPDDTGARWAYFPVPVCTGKTAGLTVGRVQPGA